MVTKPRGISCPTRISIWIQLLGGFPPAIFKAGICLPVQWISFFKEVFYEVVLNISLFKRSLKCLFWEREEKITSELKSKKQNQKTSSASIGLNSQSLWIPLDSTLTGLCLNTNPTCRLLQCLLLQRTVSDVAFHMWRINCGEPEGATNEFLKWQTVCSTH